MTAPNASRVAVGVRDAAAAFHHGLLSPAEELRHRADAFGMQALDERETLTLLLVRSAPRQAEALAGALLQRFGCVARVLGASVPELCEVTTRRVALDLKLIHDATRRVLEFPILNRPVMASFSAVLAYLRHVMACEPREMVRVLYLDTKLKLIRDEVHSRGTHNHAPVYPREIMRRALELNAAKLLLAHQHPSLDPTPSTADVELTKQVVEAAKALGIEVLDHIVIGGDTHASLRTLGLM